MFVVPTWKTLLPKSDSNTWIIYYGKAIRIFVRGICARCVDVVRRSANKDSAHGFGLRVARYRAEFPKEEDIMRCCAVLTVVLGMIVFPAYAEDYSQEDAKYVVRFLEKFPKVDPAPTFDTYATTARYDELYLGDNLAKALKKVSNDTGGIAWGLSYRMMSLNQMYRVTADAKYLEANRKCIRAVMAARDDKIGKKLWTDVVAPAWGSDKYAKRGRAIFAVHTGIITYPMLDFLLLAKQDEAFAIKLDDAVKQIETCCLEALAFHDRQWREGPGDGEGYYIGLDQEEVCENKPLPGNRLSAMGLALWTSWKLTGNETHRDRARAIGLYIKHRLTPEPDGAYYWPYWLPIDPVTEPAPRESVKGEDSSHAGLTLALPLMLAADNEVFTTEDVTRFGNTLIKGFGRLENGILFGDITGNPASSPNYVGQITAWAQTAKQVPAVRDLIITHYLNYRPTPGALDLSRLIPLGTPSTSVAGRRKPPYWAKE